MLGGDIYRKLRDLRDRYADEIRRRYPPILRRISGYNLNALLPEHGFDVARALVGTEGTCVTLLEAKLRLVYSPPHRVVVLLGYPDIYTAGDHAVVKGRTSKHESIHPKSSHAEFLELLPEGQGYLMLELGGDTKEEAIERAREMMAELRKGRQPLVDMRMYSDREHIEHAWMIRESGLGATARVPGQPDTWPGWEDSASRARRRCAPRPHPRQALHPGRPVRGAVRDESRTGKGSALGVPPGRGEDVQNSGRGELEGRSGGRRLVARHGAGHGLPASAGHLP